MRAEIITIGDELLLGQTLDTNSSWISGELHNIGVSVYQVSSIQDDAQQILDTIDIGLSRSDLVLVTGGLGPTKDDITKNVLCKFFESGLVLNEIMYEKIKTFFDELNLPMIDSNIQQAYLPEKCNPIINQYGTAAGMWFEKDGKVLVAMPGVPHEMIKMMQGEVLEKIKLFFATEELYYKMIYTEGIGESFLVERIKVWEDSLELEAIKIAYLPERGKVKIRLSSNGDDKDFLKLKIKRKTDELKKLIPEFIIEPTLVIPEIVIGEWLRSKGQTIATAESCTGGKIASKITAIPGSSDYFEGAVVAYQERVKEESLSVDKNLINQFGVVSVEVAEAMVIGVCEKLGTDWGVSTTGYAGPSGGTAENPVGTVCIAVCNGSKIIKSYKKFFRGNREEIIEKASNFTLRKINEVFLLIDV